MSRLLPYAVAAPAALLLTACAMTDAGPQGAAAVVQRPYAANAPAASSTVAGAPATSSIIVPPSGAAVPR